MEGPAGMADHVAKEKKDFSCLVHPKRFARRQPGTEAQNKRPAKSQSTPSIHKDITS
jgi:hypothetical protein